MFDINGSTSSCTQLTLLFQSGQHQCFSHQSAAALVFHLAAAQQLASLFQQAAA
jgi:hypothetical protein